MQRIRSTSAGHLAEQYSELRERVVGWYLAAKVDLDLRQRLDMTSTTSAAIMSHPALTYPVGQASPLVDVVDLYLDYEAYRGMPQTDLGHLR